MQDRYEDTACLDLLLLLHLSDVSGKGFDLFDAMGPMTDIVPKDMYGTLHIWVKLLNVFMIYLLIQQRQGKSIFDYSCIMGRTRHAVKELDNIIMMGLQTKHSSGICMGHCISGSMC